MRPLRERKGWKILAAVIFGLLILMGVLWFAAITIDRSFAEKNTRIGLEAGKAGYDEKYFPCEILDNVVIDGKEYICAHAFRSVVVDGNYSEYIIFDAGSVYKDEAEGGKTSLTICGKRLGYSGKYTVIEPYGIYPYYDAGSIWYMISAVIMIGIVDAVLFVVLAGYFAVHIIRRSMDRVRRTADVQGQ